MSDWHAHLRTLCGKRPVAFYEKVLILDTTQESEIRGKHGWVLGVSADDALIHEYQVHFDAFEIGYGVRPEDLEGTGEIAPRERFYAGEATRVRVDAQGRGHVAD